MTNTESERDNFTRDLDAIRRKFRRISDAFRAGDRTLAQALNYEEDEE